VPMVAIAVFPFSVAPLHCDLDGGRETGDARPCTRRAGTKWKAAGDGFFASRCKARSRAAERSWRRTLRETSEAQPVFGQTHANRDRGWSARLGKSGEYGNGGRPSRVTARERKRCWPRWPMHTTLILAATAHPRPWARRMPMRPCSRTIAA